MWGTVKRAVAGLSPAGGAKKRLENFPFLSLFFRGFNPFFFPENIKREKAIAAQIIEKIFSLSKLFRHLYRKLDQ